MKHGHDSSMPFIGKLKRTDNIDPNDNQDKITDRDHNPIYELAKSTFSPVDGLGVNYDDFIDQVTRKLSEIRDEKEDTKVSATISRNWKIWSSQTSPSQQLTQQSTQFSTQDSTQFSTQHSTQFSTQYSTPYSTQEMTQMEEQSGSLDVFASQTSEAPPAKKKTKKKKKHTPGFM